MTSADPAWLNRGARCALTTAPATDVELPNVGSKTRSLLNSLLECGAQNRFEPQNARRRSESMTVTFFQLRLDEMLHLRRIPT